MRQSLIHWSQVKQHGEQGPQETSIRRRLARGATVASQRAAEALRQPTVLPADRPAAAQFRSIDAAISLLLAVTVALVFVQTARHEFVNFDDNHYVYLNSHVNRGLTLSGIEWAFTRGDADNWHPLTWISHMLDCQVYDLWAGGHHLTSAAIHAAVAVLLFLTLLQMTGSRWRCAAVVALFAVHPLRVESVAWVAERKDLLSGLFFVLTLAAYVHYVRKGESLTLYLRLWFAYLLGLMCKPMLVTLPLVLLLLDYWPLGPLGRRDPRRNTPADLGLEPGRGEGPAAAAFADVVRRDAHCAEEGVDSAKPIAWPTRLGNAVVSYAAYLGQFFWPVRLAAFYPFPFEKLSLAAVLGFAPAAGLPFLGGLRPAGAAAVLAGRLALVSDHAPAGDRPGAGRPPGPGRPLHVSAPDRTQPGPRLDRRGTA